MNALTCCCSKANGTCVPSSGLLVGIFIDRMSQQRRNPVCWFHVDRENCLGVVIRTRELFRQICMCGGSSPTCKSRISVEKTFRAIFFEVSDAVLTLDSFRDQCAACAHAEFSTIFQKATAGSSMFNSLTVPKSRFFKVWVVNDISLYSCITFNHQKGIQLQSG